MSKKIGWEEQNANDFLAEFRERWPRGKVSLLAAHFFFAVDEICDWYGYVEVDNMKEAEKMFIELMNDLKKLIPEKREKPNIKLLEEELLKTEDREDEGI